MPPIINWTREGDARWVYDPDDRVSVEIVTETNDATLKRYLTYSVMVVYDGVIVTTVCTDVLSWNVARKQAVQYMRTHPNGLGHATTPTTTGDD